jgi:hypothetical protein
MRQIELSALLGGRTVDLRTAEDLSHLFRYEVTKGAEVQCPIRAGLARE